MKILLTGGAGFIGKAIALKLNKLSHEVHVLARKNYPELEQMGIKVFKADLSESFEKMEQAFVGVDAVFHVAAKVAMWGKYADFYSTNVQGTENVIKACRKYNVGKLIYTSSPSVVADGTPLLGVDESYPYPDRVLAYYPATKAIAEQLVLAANSKELRTIALRPHLIFGPGDNNFVPLILKRAREGKLQIVGDGNNLVDLTYIDDCVDAHLLALAALDANLSACGKAFFISQGDPVPLWDWINLVLQLNGIAKLEKKVPLNIANCLAFCFETAAKLGLIKEPRLTRFLVHEMAHSHYFNISAAKEFLGYCPNKTVEAATIETFTKNS